MVFTYAHIAAIFSLRNLNYFIKNKILKNLMFYFFYFLKSRNFWELFMPYQYWAPIPINLKFHSKIYLSYKLNCSVFRENFQRKRKKQWFMKSEFIFFLVCCLIIHIVLHPHVIKVILGILSCKPSGFQTHHLTWTWSDSLSSINNMFCIFRILKQLNE